MPTSRINMICLFVSDMQRSVAFYRDGLGFQCEKVGAYTEFRHEGVRFAMYERQRLPELLEIHIDPSDEGVNFTFQISFEVDDVDVEYKRIIQSGGKPIREPKREDWGVYAAFIADPDGNLIELFQRNP